MKGTYALLKLLSKICCRLSPEAAEKVGRGLGQFFWMCVPPKRKRLAVNRPAGGRYVSLSSLK